MVSKRGYLPKRCVNVSVSTDSQSCISGDARLGDALNNKKRAQPLRTGRVNGIGMSHLNEEKWEVPSERLSSVPWEQGDTSYHLRSDRRNYRS